MKVNISAVIITYNEEHNIERCINSVKSIADEILVVDSISTDRTKEICLLHGVRFMEHPYRSQIEQKTYALAQATHNCVLSIDADEALSEKLQGMIGAVKQNWVADAYQMNRITRFCGKWIRHSGWYPDRKVRLFDKRKGKWGGENPHDKIILAPGATLKYLPGDILHHSFDTVKEHLDQINKYSEIFKEEKSRQGKRTSLLALLVKPPFKFFRGYVLQRGFLDGFEGFFIAVLSSYGVFIKYSKLYFQQREQKKIVTK